MSNVNLNELEQFRRQWQEEVSHRRRRSSKVSDDASSSRDLLGASSSSTSQAQRSQAPMLSSVNVGDAYQDTYVRGTYNFDDLEARENSRRLGTSEIGLHSETRKEPESALDHFERAVEREAQGNLQESLVHYKKAYKLDDRVDLAYRNKHFPPTKFQTSAGQAQPANTSVGVTKRVTSSSHDGSSAALSELIESFADSRIQPTTPDVEGVPKPPCPVAALPRELLTAILSQVALTDVASLMRLSYVCKQLAYLTHAEDSLWRTVCWDSRFGFSDMRYSFAMTMKWQELPRTADDSLVLDVQSLSLENKTESSKAELLLPMLNAQYPSFLRTFHARPRIRFSGVYISTVNYVRAGSSAPNSVYWGNSPVHMVTYYRYLRFYRDGSAISLLTTFEPHDVVPLLHKKHVLKNKESNTKERLPNVVPASSLSNVHHTAQNAAHGSAVQPPTINAIMKDARKSRWRLSALHDEVEKGSLTSETHATEPEGNVYIETEGPTPHYTYHMQLSMRSVKATGVALNTKLAWRSFWSHNRLTDDWGEFNLRNDKAFVFSRVKSWVDA